MRHWVAAGMVALAAWGLGGQAKPKPKVQDLKTDLKSIQNRKGALQKQLSTTRRQVRVVKGDLSQLDGRLERLESQIEVTSNRLDKGRTEQRKLGDELRVANHQLQMTREQVRQRLRWMYVHQDRTVVSALLTANDVSQVAARAALLERIAKADRELFESYQDLRVQVSQKKRRQDALVIEIAGLKQTQVGQQAEVKEVRSDKSALLGQLRSKQSELERLIRILDREESAIEAQIAAYYAGTGKSSGLKPFTGRFSRPVNAPMTSGFGMRHHPILRRTRMHNGIDFGAKSGTPIRAAADGVVIASTYSGGFGNMVILDHGGGISTLYGHCSRRAVAAGQRVSRGQVIAYVGSTGLSTGPHLHWEVRVNGRPVNPMGRV